MHIDTVKQYHTVGNDYLKCDKIYNQNYRCINRKQTQILTILYLCLF